MTNEQFEVVQQRLDAMLALMCHNLPEEKTGKSLVLALDNSGLPAKEIARMLGLKANAVRMTIKRAK